MLNKISQTIYQVISSKKFFFVVVGLLFLQAAWLALSAQYPMAFDEGFHFGIIQIYSHQWLPFITAQPPGSQAYGDLTRYDSYMYHYLMSFPYRVLALVINNWVYQVIALRFINIGLFIAGLFLFRNLLRKVHISEAMTNFSLLMLVLIPVVPFLAATINYDNLAFVVVPIFVGVAINCIKEISKHSKLSAKNLAFLLSVGIFGSLVKYAFVPIFLAGLLYILVLWLRSPSKRKVITSIIDSFKNQSQRFKIILVIILVVSGGLFAERYGVNLVQYHRFEPDCGSVRGVSDCLQYGPWGRNHYIEEVVKANNPPHDPPIAFYIPNWISNSMYRLYFAINYDFVTSDPLPFPVFTAAVVGGLGFLLCLMFWRSIIKVDRQLLLLALVIVLYVSGLFYVNFTEYMRYRTAVAVNGRYLIVILPFLFAWIALAYRRLFMLAPKSHVKNYTILVSTIVLLLVLNGGGATTYLLRSKPSWYWQGGPAPSINSELQKIIAPVVLGGRSSK